VVDSIEFTESRRRACLSQRGSVPSAVGRA